MLYSNEHLTNQHDEQKPKKEESSTKKSPETKSKEKIMFENFKKLFLQRVKEDPCLGCIN